MKCRDNVIPEVPIYPASTLVNASDTADSQNPYVGEIEQEYESVDTSEQVLLFYKEIAECRQMEIGDNTMMVCSAQPNDYLFYQVNIREGYDVTYFTLYFRWQCGLE